MHRNDEAHQQVILQPALNVVDGTRISRQKVVRPGIFLNDKVTDAQTDRHRTPEDDGGCDRNVDQSFRPVMCFQTIRLIETSIA